MIEVLIAIELVEWLSKDVHYRSNDQWFYALHLLADKIDFGTAEDDLKEAYYLGMKEALPPTERDIHENAIDRCPDVRGLDNEGLIRTLYEVCANGLYAIEEAKREAGLMAGVHAILDGVSQHLLVIRGLCWRTLNGDKDVNNGSSAS